MKNLNDILSIYDSIKTKKNSNRLDLMGGLAGTALLEFNLFESTKSDEYFNNAYESIDLIVDNINNVNSYTLAGGLSGIGWLFENIRKNSFLDIDTNEILAEIDPVIIDSIFNDLKLGNYDFFHGAIGGAVYLLSKHPSPKIDALLSNILLELDRSKVVDEKGIYWINYLKSQRDGITVIDFGFSHGLPSILMMLILFFERGINRQLCIGLIGELTRFILSEKLDYKIHDSYFPMIKQVYGQKENYGSRLAWCYGDLGVAYALRRANDILNDPVLKVEVEDILIYASGRRDLKKANIEDAYLCHGISGVSILFERLFGLTKLPQLADASAFWLEKLKNRDQSNVPTSKAKISSNEGFLEGDTGIALTLLDSLYKLQTGWKEALFLF